MFGPSCCVRCELRFSTELSGSTPYRLELLKIDKNYLSFYNISAIFTHAAASRLTPTDSNAYLLLRTA